MDKMIIDSFWAKVAILIMVMGSVVDLVQFIWIIKRQFRKLKRSMYNQIKREMIAEQLDNIGTKNT